MVSTGSKFDYTVHLFSNIMDHIYLITLPTQLLVVSGGPRKIALGVPILAITPPYFLQEKKNSDGKNFGRNFQNSINMWSIIHEISVNFTTINLMSIFILY